jgi:hypothetical protein
VNEETTGGATVVFFFREDGNIMKPAGKGKPAFFAKVPKVKPLTDSTAEKFKRVQMADGPVTLHGVERVVPLPASGLEAADGVSGDSVTIQGFPGGAFNIRGDGFGTKPGSLTIGGLLIKTTRWDDRQIRGQLPRGAVCGLVELTLADGTIRHGVYPVGTPAFA